MLVTDFGDLAGIEHFVHRIYSEFEKKTYCSSYQQKATMSVKLDAFIAAPSQKLLNLAKKIDLLDIGSHYNLSSAKASILKHEIKHIIIQFFVDEEIFEPSATV